MDRKPYSFSENGKVCAIHTPNPPRHWYNYLWNDQGYCAQVSQGGHGKSYYITDKAEMCQINGNSSRYLYLRDEESGACWNPGVLPMNEAIENFACEHSIAWSRISSTAHSIRTNWKLFVPAEGSHEVWTVTVQNESDQLRHVSLFSAVSFELEGFSYPRYYEMYRCIETSYDKELNGVYCKAAHPFQPHERYNGFLASTEPVFAYDGDLAAFCGTASTLTRPDASVEPLFQRPEVVINGRDCTGSEAALFVPGAVLQHKLTLQAGEEKEIIFVLGVAESPEEARQVIDFYRAAGHAEEACQAAEASMLRKYSMLSVHTPDERVNQMMNLWVQKQIDFCIVGKKGVRDNLQIAVALLSYRPKKAREEILECLKHQFKDGHTVLTWYPYDDTHYSDQPFWLIWAVCHLIQETGDMSVLEIVLPWQDGGEASALEHLKAAANRLMADKGPNGLCRIWFADWNDALNVTTDPNAESVMLTEQACLAFGMLESILRQVGEEKFAARLSRENKKFKAALNAAAWDGDWYCRALHQGGKIGSKESAGSKLYLNAQTWAVLGDAVPEERLPQVVSAIDSLERDFGFPLNDPPYDRYLPETGRMSGMLPGLFENGGVYCHASAFKILADCKLGRGTEALRTLKKIMPDSEKNPCRQSGAEPMVFTNCYSTHPKYYGKSYQSWTTGTSAWTFRGLTEGILGIKAEQNGLRIDPTFPAAWPSAEITRRFRGADYHIVICNPEGKEHGTPQLVVDCVPLEGNLIPAFGDSRLHEVSVVLK